MSFSHYEQYHLHEYVYKKDLLYTKTEIALTQTVQNEIDIAHDTLKTQLISLIQTNTQTLQKKN